MSNSLDRAIPSFQLPGAFFYSIIPLMEPSTLNDYLRRLVAENFLKSCSQGLEQDVVLALEHGADIHAVDHKGATGVALACISGQAGMLSVLLALAGPLEATMHSGTTWSPTRETQPQLWNNKITRPLKGMNALMIAAFRSERACVEALLAAGASTEAMNDDGETALMLAAIGGHEDCVLALLGAGACWRQRDAQGRSAVDLAQANGNERCLSILLAHEMSQTLEPGTKSGATWI